MQLQYVFGNPTKGKKSKSKKSKNKRSKTVAKKRRKKNPEKFKITAYQKGGKGKKRKKISSKTTETIATKGELQSMRARLAKERAKKAKLQDAKLGKSKKTKKAISKRVKKHSAAIKKLTKAISNEAKTRKKVKHEASQTVRDINASPDMEASKTTKRWSVAKARKKMKKRKTTRRRKKKSGSKKRASKVAKKAVRRRRKKVGAKKVGKKRRKKVSHKKVASKKAAKKVVRRKKRRKSGGKKRGSMKSRKSVSFFDKRLKKKRKLTVQLNPMRKRGNPMVVGGFKVAGYDGMELAELGAGGLLYGVANSYLSPMFAKIPGLGQFAGMLGGTLPCLLAGVALNIVSDKVKQPQLKQAASFLGDGLLGAAVVGAGVSLSQTLMPAQLSGVDYYPGLSEANKNYGGVDFTPELMGGVDYTPDLGNVDFSAGPSLPGHNLNSDFGDYEQSAADFGEIPEGLS